MVEHGGAVGEGLYWASTTLFQRLGAHILVAADARLRRPAAHRHHGRRPPSARTGRALRKAGTGTRDVARTVRDAARAGARSVGGGARRRDHDQPRARHRDVRDRAPGGRARQRRGRRRSRSTRATRRTGTPDDAVGRHPPASRPCPSRRSPRRPRRRPTPMGRRRSRDGVTESEEVDYKLPPAKALDRGKRRPGPRHARPRGDRVGAARVAAPLRGRGAAAGHGQRPAREPLRASARPGHEGLQGRPAARRPRLRAGLDRHPHPRPDPGEEGGRGRGAEPAPAPGPPRRHLRRAAEGLLAAALLARQGRLRARR